MAITINVTPDQDLQSIINSCQNPSASNIYDLILAPGTPEEPNVWHVMNLLTRDYVNIKGGDLDRRTVWIKGERPDGSSNCGAYETITYKTTSVLENLTVTCRNMRYPYHNDGCPDNTQQLIKNCHIEHLGNWRSDGVTPAPFAESGWDSCHANGCGTSSGMVVTIENSHLIGRQNGMPLYAHNAPNFTSPSRIIAKNNIIEHADNGPTVWMDGGGNSGQDDHCELIGNTMIGGGIWSQKWTFSGEGNIYDFFYNTHNQTQYIYYGPEHYKYLPNVGYDIYKGMACVYEGDGIRIMTSEDTISNFAGVAAYDIPAGDSGHFAFTAKILSNDLTLPVGVVRGDRLAINPETPGRFIRDNTSPNYVLSYDFDWIWFGSNRGKLFGIRSAVSSAGPSIKVGGTWRKVSDMYIKRGGTWRVVQELFGKQGGTWRKEG